MAEKLYIRDFTVEQIVNEVPLYQKIYVSLEQTQSIAPYYEDIIKYNELLSSDTKIMSECVECGERQTFSQFTEKRIYPLEPISMPVIQLGATNKPIPNLAKIRLTCIRDELKGNQENGDWMRNGEFRSYEYFLIRYTCPRFASHTMSIAFKLSDEGTELSIMKIGQYPALSMLIQKAIRLYRKELKEHDYNELSKALQLHSNGFSVASFVYLRRIYENLIEMEHEKQCSSIGDWNEEEYQKQSFGERVKILVDNGADIIPNEIDNHKANIYRILSLGVHQYSEEECTQYFDVLFSCITLILEHSIAVKTRAARIHSLNATLTNIP